MPLIEHSDQQPIIIQSITPDQFTINEQIFDHSVILTADFQILTWKVQKVEELTRELLQPLLQGQPEVVLIGTGTLPIFLSPTLMTLFYERGIGVEIMTTSAAARTYTVLSSEDRKVAAALLLS